MNTHVCKAMLAPALVALLATAGCADEQVFTEALVLGGEVFEPDTLNAGKTAYTHNCYACHGHEGDGEGPAAYSYWPPPRDFSKVAFKFAGVPEGEVPTDEELMRIVRHGLNGTAMLPWDLSEEDLWLAIQYLKTFSPCEELAPSDEHGGALKCVKGGKGWHHKRRVPTAPDIPADPFALIPEQALWSDDAFGEWADAQRASGASIPTDAAGYDTFMQDKRAEAQAKKAEAIAMGEKMYHQGGCQLCHPAYVEPEQIVAHGGQPRAMYPYDPDPKYSKTYEVVLVPPDFLRTPIRSARQYWDAEGNVQYDPRDFYRVIASGIPGTAMPSWAALPPEQVWAVSHYVAELSEKRDTAEARAMRDELLAAPAYEPPEPEPEPAEEAAPAEGEAAEAEAEEAEAPAEE